MNEKMESWRAINEALTKEALTMFGSFPSPKSLNLSESKSFQSPSCCRSAIECLEIHSYISSNLRLTIILILILNFNPSASSVGEVQ